MAHKAAGRGVDSFSGIVQQWKPAAPKTTMVLKSQMVRSRAVGLACDDVGSQLTTLVFVEALLDSTVAKQKRCQILLMAAG